MSKFLQGFGGGVADASDAALKDLLEQRRSEAVARLSAQLQGGLQANQQDFAAKQALGAQDFERERDKTRSADESARLDKTLTGQKEVAKIGADARITAAEARADATTAAAQLRALGGGGGSAGGDVKINYKKVLQADGSEAQVPDSVEQADSRGRKVVIPYQDYLRYLNPQAQPSAGSTQPAADVAPAADPAPRNLKAAAAAAAAAPRSVVDDNAGGNVRAENAQRAKSQELQQLGVQYQTLANSLSAAGSDPKYAGPIQAQMQQIRNRINQIQGAQ